MSYLREMKITDEEDGFYYQEDDGSEREGPYKSEKEAAKYGGGTLASEHPSAADPGSITDE